jgi:chromosome segregation ATPase
MAQAYPARLWEARKALKATDEALTEARGHDAALAQAQRDEPARHEQFAARIAGLDQRIRALTPRVAALIREQQGQVQELAVAELSRQKERLAVYATQARFAVAQLYDRAAMARDVDHARKQ